MPTTSWRRLGSALARAASALALLFITVARVVARVPKAHLRSRGHGRAPLELAVRVSPRARARRDSPRRLLPPDHTRSGTVNKAAGRGSPALRSRRSRKVARQNGAGTASVLECRPGLRGANPRNPDKFGLYG